MLRYIKRALNFAIAFEGMKILGGEDDGRKSTLGYLFNLGSIVILWDR